MKDLPFWIACTVATSLAAGCGGGTSGGISASYVAHASGMAISRDGSTLFVANPDADSVSVLNAAQGTLVREILLAAGHPAVDPVSGAYTPAVRPRDVALSPDEATLYVVGQRSGLLYAVDLASGAIAGSVAVGSEPIAVLPSLDGSELFLTASQDANVVRVSARGLNVTGTVAVGGEPWALAFAGGALQVTDFLRAAVTRVDPGTLAVTGTATLPDAPPRGDPRLAHGQPRGLYDLAARPGTDDVWVAHTLLGTDTAQPALNFESTAFAALSIVHAGAFQQVLSVHAQDVSGVNGAFGDVVSGPHALAFTGDGEYALMVDANSEDLMLVDARAGAEVSLVRPLPGHQPEAVALAPDETRAYVYERNTNDVAILDLDRSTGTLVATVDAGTPAIPTLAADPMPPALRLGQHLFYSANSDEYPLTTNHWIACATCHMEGRSDAVTWKFAQGPRDTPSNAGGTLGTGFLFRTADRNQVQDYWRTIKTEQGGNFDPTDPAQASLLDALAGYVNLAIPLPVPPTTDPALVARGQALFNGADVGCAGCHAGPRFTDSGAGNPTLDLAGPVLLHDVGTCVTVGYPDVAHTDIDGDPRAACAFDTPSLNGVASSPPYMHDGSSPTLADAVARMLASAGAAPVTLSPDDQAALVEYLRSL